MATQLVPLQEVERLSSRVIRILAGNPGKFTLQGTNTYLIGTGRQRLLIDTGEGKPTWIAAVKKVIKEENVTITEAILTHWHHDHVNGQSDLSNFSPGTIIYKNTPAKGQFNVEEGQTFKVDGASLKAVYSPGHTQDHMALLLEEEDAMFTGDNVLGHGTAVFEDLTQYISSLEKMRALFRGRAYPGHGAVIEDGPSKIVEYIRHRKMREDQVVQVLRSLKADPGLQVAKVVDEWTAMEVVKVIYRDVPENLHVPAMGGIVGILKKLGSEGKVEKTVGGAWRIAERAGL